MVFRGLLSCLLSVDRRYVGVIGLFMVRVAHLPVGVLGVPLRHMLPASRPSVLLVSSCRVLYACLPARCAILSRSVCHSPACPLGCWSVISCASHRPANGATCARILRTVCLSGYLMVVCSASSASDLLALIMYCWHLLLPLSQGAICSASEAAGLPGLWSPVCWSLRGGWFAGCL